MGRTDERESHPRRSGWLLRGAGTAVTALVLAGLVPGTAVAAPGDDQVAAAQAERDVAAARVGEIGAQLAAAQERVDAARRGAQIALQEYEVRRAAQEEARATADAAAAAAERAAAELRRGRDQVVAFARSSYMQGSTSPGAAALVTAEGPAQLVQRAALLEAAGGHRADVVAELTVLEQEAAAADDAAQVAVQAAGAAEAAAAESLASAQSQEVSARAQAAELADRREVLEAELAEAQEVLYGAQGAAAAAAAAEAAAGAAQAHPPVAPPVQSSSSPRSSSSTSSSGSSSSSSGGGAPTGTGTTAGAPTGSVVDRAIAAAVSQRGLPYSWGGGNGNGPTYGIPPDTAIYGFDCSGLTEYAYAQAGIRIGGTSREQYWRFRDRTVAADDLQPGDLVFWGETADYTSIYHVALYIGGGQVVQAPQSGDVVRISSMWFGSDYYGAVRPTA
ncbi:NlpC/P60 family protein [Geodermatophilus obscurus]|uniref:NLP/P60 protein n=1 Tax=Geodermatophilus obscurus (strain ATCC 25078 / DSM 43160 / JCM 3152 / CCUG 61914 / KCC A-0152 / KCTC 9177 / NBRC 13315 / NRRL B-3577 / G-20) TaxID=526225 RepID=D2SFL8_GEOOG|nr:C40 family peptidase [Geodermatophilus obscurus]ADB74773.1 NLP/P60 protein [Geodermatophilus obscurus DSM 43160]